MVCACYSIGWESEKKFDMVHIQNATLAGGVAMGSMANFAIQPWLSILVGFGAGLLSTYGYHAITGPLRERLNIDDTCGVHNLHGMPGIFGAVLSAIAILTLDDNETSGITYDDRSKGSQAGFQLLALAVTLGIAVFGAAITAQIVKFLCPAVKWPLGAFTDHTMFEVPDDFISAGQAAQGERGVTPSQAARAHCAPVFPDIEAPAAAAPADDGVDAAAIDATLVDADSKADAAPAPAGDGIAMVGVGAGATAEAGLAKQE